MNSDRILHLFGNVNCLHQAGQTVVKTCWVQCKHSIDEKPLLRRGWKIRLLPLTMINCLVEWLTDESAKSLLQKQLPEVFYKKAVLKNFAIFTGKYLCWSLFLIKLQACNFIKKRFQHRCLPVNIAKFLKTANLKNICRTAASVIFSSCSSCKSCKSQNLNLNLNQILSTKVCSNEISTTLSRSENVLQNMGQKKVYSDLFDCQLRFASTAVKHKFLLKILWRLLYF